MCQECDLAVQPTIWGTTVYSQTTKLLYYGSEMCTVLCAIIHIASIYLTILTSCVISCLSFPQHGLVYPTAQGPLLQKYLEALVQLLSPGEESVSKSHSLSSMKEFVNLQSAHSALRRSSQAVPPTHHYHHRKEASLDNSLADDEDPEETEL